MNSEKYLRSIRGIYSFFLLPGVLTLLVTGCTVITTGHRFDQKRISIIEIGTTTKQDVIRFFGPPDDVVYNHGEGAKVYIYKYLTNTTVGIPFVPPIALLTVGWTRLRGYEVNIMIDDDSGTVRNYEVNEFKETFFRKNKSEK